VNERPIYHTTEVVAELRREYGWRKRLYPTWVKQGRMRDVDAHRQMQILDQVIQDYQRKTMDSDLFAIRLTASQVAAEVAGMILNGVNGTASQYSDAVSSAAERIARAMKEGK
jgi:hypothetical protein